MASPRLPDSRPRRRSGLSLVGVLVGACALVTTGCMTGERPSFDDDQPEATTTGDAAIDEVLSRLDRVSVEQFTADYAVLTRLGGIESTATVSQADNSRRSITINQIRFIDGSGTVATCDLATGECEAIINDARVSDVQMSHDFYGASMARRLRVDATRKIDDARGHEETFAGRPAYCADVPVSGGTKVYCALDSGALAKYDGNDLLIELAAYAEAVDETLFATG